LGLLVLKPDLGRQLDSTLLPNNERRDQQLFHALVAHIEAHQDMSTAALLGFWHGTPEGQLLAELAGREPLEDERGQQALFFALLEQQARERQLMQLRERLDALKATPYANLLPEEKQELLTLTTEIRTLSGRR
jgi:DNA primase